MSRIITGSIITILGVCISIISVLDLAKDWQGLIPGVIFIVVGLFIFFNKKEDKIEEIKDSKKNK